MLFLHGPLQFLSVAVDVGALLGLDPHFRMYWNCHLKA